MQVKLIMIGIFFKISMQAVNENNESEDGRLISDTIHRY